MTSKNWVASGKEAQPAAVEPEGGIPCRACSHVNPYSHTDLGYWVGNRLYNHVFACQRCGGVQGSAGYLGDLSGVVKQEWDQGECAEEDQRYFDLDYVSSQGQHRTHGWFNIKTRRITQTG